MRKLKKEHEEKSGLELAALISEVALDHKAEELVVLDVRGIASFTDFYIIMSGRSTRHVQSLAETIEEHLRSKRVSSKNSEGLREGHWVLLDFGDVVTHIFYHEARNFYDLEGLWHEAPRLGPEELQGS
jgi:ribosome-associated protein